MAVQIEVLRGLRLWGVTVPTVRDLRISSSHVEREGFRNARDLTTPLSTVDHPLRVHLEGMGLVGRAALWLGLGLGLGFSACLLGLQHPVAPGCVGAVVS